MFTSKTDCTNTTLVPQTPIVHLLENPTPVTPHDRHVIYYILYFISIQCTKACVCVCVFIVCFCHSWHIKHIRRVALFVTILEIDAPTWVSLFLQYQIYWFCLSITRALSYCDSFDTNRIRYNFEWERERIRINICVRLWFNFLHPAIESKNQFN